MFDLPSTAKRTRLSFSARTSTPALTARQSVELAEIYCGDGAVNDGVWIVWKPNNGSPSIFVVTQKGAVLHNLVGALEPCARVVIDATWTGAAFVSVSVEGGPVVTDAISSTCPTQLNFRAAVGVSTLGGPLAEARFDDVLVEIDPP